MATYNHPILQAWIYIIQVYVFIWWGILLHFVVSLLEIGDSGIDVYEICDI